MSYASIEASVQRGAPVELYEFVQGTSRWNYCSGAEPIERGGIVYQPSSIQRDRVKQSTDVFKNGLRLTLPRTNEFAGQYIGFAPDDVTTLTVFRGHYTDPDSQFTIYWKGRVMSARAAESRVEIECEPIYTSIKRPGLRAKFEYGCRHALYGKRCGVVKEDYELVGVVVSIAGGLDVVVAGADAEPSGFYSGGMLVDQFGAARFLVVHADSTVTLSRPMPELAAGQLVKLYPGCDHLRVTCRDKFDNLPNFGGFPWIPSRNPFDGSSII